jgi:MFS superfamily sulfate permease-like transporter
MNDVNNAASKPVDVPPQAPLNSFKQDFMGSIVVFLVALPLCMGIAIASGVPVAAGLITGIVGGLVVGFIAGCPLQVSGPAAGLTVIVIEIVQRFGLETLGIIVLMAGLIQMLAGVLRLGQWFRAVSPAVIKGMLAGIGVLIFASQFHVMVDDKPKHSGIENLLTIPQAISKAFSIAEFRPLDSRRFHRRMLQSVGELHRQQIEIEERVGEKFPHIHDPSIEFTPDQIAAAQASLPQFVAEQQKINAQLKSIVDELQTMEQHLANETQAQAVMTGAQAAMLKNETALATFNNVDSKAMLAAQDEAANALQQLLNQLKNHHLAAYLGIFAIACIIIWHYAPEKLRVIPGPLIAVVLTTLVAITLCFPVLYVEIPDRLWDGIHFPSLALLAEGKLWLLVQSAVVIAIVASAETLLCATAVDQLHDGPRTNYDRELLAQGVGNSICGILGVLPMTGVIVRSSANVHAGAKTKMSAILHGVWLLLFVVAFGFLLRQIPTAALAAILVYTGFKLVNIKAIKDLAQFGYFEVFIYFATVTTIVCTDLLTGVLVGIGLAGAKLLHTFSHLDSNLQIDPSKTNAVLTLNGSATFLRLPLVAAELEKVPRGAELHVDFQYLNYIDHACLELIMNWAKQHEQTGGKLVIDWESLHARFRNGGQSSRGLNDRSRSMDTTTAQPPTFSESIKDA